MSKENKEEKLFNELMDRIMAGESVEIDATDTDMRSAIEFAKKIKELRTSPSEPFKANLKARLLQQLEGTEMVREKMSWWQRMFSNRMAWQLATTAALILIAVGITWRVGFYHPGDTTNLTAMPPKSYDMELTEQGFDNNLTGDGTTETFVACLRNNGLITANAVTDKFTYLPGEAVNITIYLTNESPAPIEIPPYPPVLISNSGEQVIFTFGALNGAMVLLPGETSKFKVIWNQFDSDNNATIPGVYYITIADITDDGNNIGVNNTANKFEIK